MAVEIILQRKLGALRPIDPIGEELMAGLPEGKDMKAKITVPRKGWKHRKFFALCAVVQPHQDTYPTIEKFRKALTAALGFADTYKREDGAIVVFPQSIAYHKMSDDEFDVLFSKAVAFICERIVPGMDSDDLEREVNEIMNGRQRA